jgi:dTDP-4-dehydrorhamnose reductase
MEKILVTGANGLVGQQLVKLLLQNEYKVVAVGKGPSRLSSAPPLLNYYSADITHPFELQQILKSELPDVVVHAAAMTQVDECEQRQKEAHSLNVEATARLLLDAETYSNFFLFLSTDFVFDGEKGMYSEEDEVNPISWYGHTKVEAEAVVHTSEIPFAIVRTCLVYGPAEPGGRNNIYSWVKNSLSTGKQIQVVDDQWRTPTSVEDLAKGILLIIKKRATGIWHLSGKDRTTPYGMAITIAELYGYDKALIERVTAASFTQPGKRPAKTGFNISKAVNEIGFDPDTITANLEKLKG